MTLFVLLLDPDRDRIAWVRAGHDPAILYDPSVDRFDTLTGPGLPLGVDDATTYAVQHRDGVADGTVVLLGTDGIWETFNPQGEMFGKERLFSLLRSRAGDRADTIRDGILEALRAFRGSAALEDDVTLVIAKLDRRQQGRAASSAPGDRPETERPPAAGG